MIGFDVTFFENIPYFSVSLGPITTPSTTHVTLHVPLQDSPTLQVYQCKKITIDLDSLPAYQSTASTNVIELQ